MNDRELMRMAIQARDCSYSPYSNFRVGAALLCADGSVYTGCNVENAAFGPGVCAERTAFVKAVSEGNRSFQAIAVAGGPADGALSLTAPCGVCRQVMREFCDPESFRVILGTEAEGLASYLLKELLPLSFGPDNLASAGERHVAV